MNTLMEQENGQSLTGIQLRVERARLGVKQIELAAKTGIDRVRLSQYENGWIKELKPEELTKLAKALNDYARN